MDFFQLKCFQSIVESGSFSEAAFALSISQSSVSKNIAKLEAELAVPLFERASGKVRLTPAGDCFRLHAETILREHEETILDLKRYHAKTEIRFGCLENIAKTGLAKPISSYMREHPGVRLNLSLGHSLHLLDQLEAGKVNPALIMELISYDGKRSNLDGRDLSAYDAFLLSEDEYLVTVAENHPLAKRSSLSWEDILKEPLIFFDQTYSLTRMLEDAFRRHGAAPNIAIECNSVDNILGLVAWNSGITLLPDSISRKGYEVAAIPMEQPIVRRELLLVRRDSLKKASVSGFVDFLLAHYGADRTEDLYPLPGSR